MALTGAAVAAVVAGLPRFIIATPSSSLVDSPESVELAELNALSILTTELGRYIATA
jgi:hypothetical protein